MIALTSSVLVASLLGSAHCAGMCGGLVAMVSAPGRQPHPRAWLAPILYNSGRGVAYVILGAAAGMVGGGFNASGTWLGVQHTAALAAGAAIIAFGLLQLAAALGLSVPRARPIEPLRRLAVAAHQRALRLHPLWRAGVAGVLTPLLPCGWLYAFVALAAGTGGPAAGAAAMAAFWLGTLPALAAIGIGAHRALGPLAKHLPLATSILVLASGVYAVTIRLTPGGCCDHSALTSPEASTCDCGHTETTP